MFHREMEAAAAQCFTLCTEGVFIVSSMVVILKLKRSACMAGDNLQRMIRLADEVFAFRTDPDQIVVTEEVRGTLASIHPATLNSEENEDGPIAWMLLIPTTTAIMNDFLAKRISERELLGRTPVPGIYNAIYLCSALVLPEFRNQGIARRLVLDAIRRMRVDHPIKALFVWPFTGGGKRLARAIAEELQLPLYEREP